VVVDLARYDEVADFYEAGWDDSCDDPATRSLLELAGDVAGAPVLDLACGHGRVTRWLARCGAEVTGADISARLIERALAAEHARPLGIRYLHADAAAVDWLPGAEFDIVTCNFGLSDIDDLDHALASAARLLRAGGQFVFSILLPVSPAVRTCPVPGRPRARTTPRAGGVRTESCPRFAARLVPATGPWPLTSTRCPARPVARCNRGAFPAGRLDHCPARRRALAGLPRGPAPQAVSPSTHGTSGR
jgi:ubiquinone/menaquinone biosynthesis C-methylase UbiE